MPAAEPNFLRHFFLLKSEPRFLLKVLLLSGSTLLSSLCVNDNIHCSVIRPTVNRFNDF